MPEDMVPINNVAPLRNVSALSALIERVAGRDFGLPGMACFYGPSGYGKSIAATWCANRFDARLVQVKSSWTSRKLCEAILLEMGIKPRGSIADMIDAISERLGVLNSPLIIDEADHLAKHGMIEHVRDIYEGCQVPVILIGEELLPQVLQRWERVHGRMYDWVQAQEGTRSDVDLLANLYARGIEIESPLKDAVAKYSRGSVRRICVNLALVREHALTQGTTKVTVASWGGRPFFSGIAPEARRVSA